MSAGPEILTRLHAAIQARQGADPASSYTAKLFSRGVKKIAQKVGEEAVETALAAVSADPVETVREETVKESADLLYHLLVLWTALGIEPDAVFQELARREGISGIAEKNARPKG